VKRCLGVGLTGQGAPFSLFFAFLRVFCWFWFVFVRRGSVQVVLLVVLVFEGKRESEIRLVFFAGSSVQFVLVGRGSSVQFVFYSGGAKFSWFCWVWFVFAGRRSAVQFVGVRRGNGVWFLFVVRASSLQVLK